MQIGFFVQGEGKHWDVAKHLLASARKYMPDVPVIHLTDGVTPHVPGVDQCFRVVPDMPMAVRRMTHHSMLHGDWLFIDTDCVFQRGVREVFDSEFDIAVTDRKGTVWDGTWYSDLMPFNMGVTFSRSPAFWKAVLEEVKASPPKFQQWEGDQLAVGKLYKDWKTHVLPGLVYNFTPENRTDDRSHAAIVHYKGKRKDWIGNDR